MCVHNNSKTAEVNLIKFNTMVKHNEKVGCAQKLGFQGQGHSHRFIPYKSSIHNNSERIKKIESASEKGKTKLEGVPCTKMWFPYRKFKVTITSHMSFPNK